MTTEKYPELADWWDPKTLDGLLNVPHNQPGWCRCPSTCGPNPVKHVKGSLFRLHWARELELAMEYPDSALPSSSRLPVLPASDIPDSTLTIRHSQSPAPADQLPPRSGTTPREITSPSTGETSDRDRRAWDDDVMGLGAEGSGVLDEYDGDDAMGHRSGQLDSRSEVGSEADEENWRLSMVAQLGQASCAGLNPADPDAIEAPSRPPTPPSSFETQRAHPPSVGNPLAPPTIDRSAVVEPADLHSYSTGPSDQIPYWPYPLPRYMLEPSNSGRHPNPHNAKPDTPDTATPFLHRILPLNAASLSGAYNVPRRAAEKVLRIGSVAIGLAARSLHDIHVSRVEKAFQKLQEGMQGENQVLLDGTLDELLDGMATDLTKISAIPSEKRQLKATFKDLGVDDSVIVHPVCKSCSKVFYHIVKAEDFANLPTRCPGCSNFLKIDGKPHVAHFPRRSLEAEVESAFRIEGFEEAFERLDERRRMREAQDAKDAATDRAKRAKVGDDSRGWSKVYRQQDDGSAWPGGEGTGEEQPSSGPDVLHLVGNLSWDTADANSSRSSATASFGPISMQFGGIPPELGGSFPCCMVLGVTPGPRAPSAADLWQFLLPFILELRSAGRDGIWIKTPKYPKGRLIRISLGLISADRPAAVEITGGPNYKADDTPCLRCIAQSKDITKLGRSELRDSFSHNRATCRQAHTVPVAVQLDREKWRTSARSRAEAYPVKRQQKAANDAKEQRGELSALVLLPGFDKFGRTVFDPMHSLLEGALKTYFRGVLSTGTAGRPDQKKAGGDRGDEEGGEDGEGGDAGVEEGGDEEDGYASDASTVAVTSAQANQLVDAACKGWSKKRKAEVVSDLRKVLKKRKKATPRAHPKMSDHDTSRLQQLVSEVVTPSSIVRLHRNFGSTSGGSPSASQWRAFGTIYGPLVLPLLFAERGANSSSSFANPHLSPDELNAMMSLFEIISLALRSVISDVQVDVIEDRIIKWLGLVFRLHPSLVGVTNLHILTHLAEDIRRFGPTYGWWTFLVERINYAIKNTNRSGGSMNQAEVVAFKAMLRARDIVRVRMEELERGEGTTLADRDAMEKVEDILAGVGMDSAAEKFEEVADRYREIDRSAVEEVRRYAAGVTRVKTRGVPKPMQLSDYLQLELRRCLEWYGQPATTDPEGRTESMPFVRKAATFWQGIDFDSRRFDSAEWHTGKVPEATVVSPAVIDALLKARNSRFEARPDHVRFRAVDEHRPAGVICAIFEHQCRDFTGNLTPPDLYAVVRRFVPAAGPDSYGYRRFPNLGVWTWQSDTLAKATVIRLTGSSKLTADPASLRPLASILLPANPTSPTTSSRILATIPHHPH